MIEYEEDKIKLYDYVIKNDDFEKTVQVIMTIIENEKRIEEHSRMWEISHFTVFFIEILQMLQKCV